MSFGGQGGIGGGGGYFPPAGGTGGGGGPSGGTEDLVAVKGSLTIFAGETYKKVSYADLGRTPLSSEIIIQGTNRGGSTRRFWITDITPTSFVIQMQEVPGLAQLNDFIIRTNVYTFDQTRTDFTKLIELRKRYPKANMWVLCNWANGPDAGAAPATTAARLTLIQNMQAVGIWVGGYVFCNYGTNPARTVALINTDVNNWKSMFNIDFILFDEMNSGSDPTTASFFQALSDNAKSQGIKYTIGNPGTDLVNEVMAPTMDFINLSEQSTLPGITRYTSPAWKLKYSKRKWHLDWHTAYYYDSNTIESYLPYVGGCVITDDSAAAGANPWENISSYIDTVLWHQSEMDQKGFKSVEDWTIDWAILKG